MNSSTPKSEVTLEEARKSFDEVTLTDIEIFERVRKLKMSWTTDEQNRRSAMGVARRNELVSLCNSELEFASA